MRCVQPAQYLKGAGWSVSVGCVYRDMPRASRAIIFHRLSADPMGLRAIRLARARGLYLFYDVDDLIFDKTGASHLEKFIRKKESGDISQKYRDAMNLCDAILCSTQYLAERAERFHPNVTVMKNGLSQGFIDLANDTRSQGFVQKRSVTLGYFSGSSHHDDDFALIQPALFRVMKEFPQTRLLLAGKVNFDPDFSNFGERFEYRSFMPYAQFMRMPSEVDVNLVPLICRDPFAQARSELKYIEAAAYGVPSIASPTSTYKNTISHGQTGLIANDDDWYTQLRSLIADHDLRQKLGIAACQDTLENYGPGKREVEWDNLINTLSAPSPARERRIPIYQAARQKIDINRRALRRLVKRIKS